jgi:hypothetical protein
MTVIKNESKKDFSKQGNVLKYEKKKWLVIFASFALIYFIPMFWGVLKNIISIFIYNKSNSNIKSQYIIFIAISAFLLVYSVILLGYFGNKIIISESYIIIKRAILAKTYTINRKSIIGSHTVMTPKGSNYFIIFYLESGKAISTGYLYCTNKEELNKINNKLKFKPYMNIKNHSEKLDKVGNKDFIVENNFIVALPIYFFSMVIIVTILFLVM